MDPNQDQQYIENTIKGDVHAFAVLVNRYKPMVFTLALRMVKNREEAEEVAQDAFLKAYHNLSKFKGHAQFSTWLYKITYNRSLDYIKKQAKNLKTTGIDDYTERYVRTDENVLQTMEAIQDRALIKKMIQQLPKSDGVLITLHYFEGLSLKEISKIVGKNSNTLKVQLYRCRIKLAAILKSHLSLETIGNYGQK